MPSAQKPAGAEDAERALSRDQPVAADAAAPTPANIESTGAAGAEVTVLDFKRGELVFFGDFRFFSSKTLP